MFENILEDIKIRLSGFGYTVTDADLTVIEFIKNKTIETFLNETNQKEVPEGLYYKLVDSICADFLGAKYATGGLSEAEIGGVVAKIQEGDTTVEMGSVSSSSTPTGKFLAILDAMKLPMSEIVKYRKMVW